MVAGMELLPPSHLPRPRSVSAKRTWPRFCGRLPAPPPATDEGGKGAGVVVEAMVESLGAPEGNGVAVGNGLVAEERGGGELEGIGGGGDGGGKKRWSVSAVHPPPKRRAVPAKGRFPPGCGRATSEEDFLVKATAADDGLPRWEKAAAAVALAPRGGGSDGNAEGRSSEDSEEVAGKVHCAVRVSHVDVATDVVEDDSTRGRQEGALVRTVSVSQGSDERTRGEGLLCEGNSAVRAFAELDKGESECGGSLQRVVAAAMAEGPSAENTKGEGRRLEDNEGAVIKANSEVSESHVAADVVADDPTRGRHESTLLPTALVRRGSDERTRGERLQREGRRAAPVVAGHYKGESKCGGSLAMSGGSSAENMKGKEVLGSDGRNKLPQVAVGVSGVSNLRSKMPSMKKKLSMFTPRKVVQSLVQGIQEKPVVDTLHRSLGGDKKDGETEFGGPATNQIEDDNTFDVFANKLIVLALAAPDKCPWTHGSKSTATVSDNLAPRKTLKKQDTRNGKQLPESTSTHKLLINEKLEYGEASKSEQDDDGSKELVVCQGKLELCVNLHPCVPSVFHNRRSGNQDAEARSKVRMICRTFQLICRKLVQADEQQGVKVRRVDLAADKAIRKLPGFTKLGPIVGNVPGVEVGDEFLYRVELAIVGLHRPYQGGIDTTKDNDMLIAISIVASGGYPDELSSSGELIYTGSGGKHAGKKEDEDQKLERGNLALKNCIKTKTPVRVIHGFKGQSREEAGHSRSKQISTFTYDGLYMAVDCWREGPPGSRVFKYRLQRVPGQPELPLHRAMGMRKSKVRAGLCMADISQGKEMIPICVINTIDNEWPAPFKYLTKIIYPSWCTKEHPLGCDCTDGCSDSARCSCSVKNGGEIPFNFSGAIVHAKPLIFECGPSCKCPPTCHNRVSHHGIKIPLEIFKTGKTGWGVRSLSSIPSGSFICEYVGELLQEKEAEQRSNDEYLFDIGHNFADEKLLEGLPSIIPGLKSSGSSYQTVEDKGFTIDAAAYGNIGRFINHSCSPNLYAQNVLWDHNDKRMPHIMLFAAENIPPLQELTYHYNYKIDQVHDVDGKLKVKYCHCGSPECCGRLY